MGRFDREQQTYEREKQNLLQYEGEYVVIFGDHVLGHWASRDQAYREGRETYGRRPFMMARISRHEPSYFQPYVGIAVGDSE